MDKRCGILSQAIASNPGDSMRNDKSTRQANSIELTDDEVELHADVCVLNQ